MSFESYKLNGVTEKASQKLYKREELEALDLAALKEICNAEHIKAPFVGMLSDKEELIELIFRYRGAVSENFIDGFLEERISFLETLLKEKGSEQKNAVIELPPRLKIYQGLDSLNDEGCGHQVITTLPLREGNALMVDKEGSIHAVLRVFRTASKGIWQLELPRQMLSKNLKPGTYKNFSLLFFEKQHRDEVVRAYHTMSARNPISYVKADITEVLVLDVPQTEEVLVIDYGTSYTTAGTYSHPEGASGKIRFSFIEQCKLCESGEEFTACARCGSCELCPSIVAVKECKDNHIEFLFGREAGLEAKKRGYMAKNSTFYDTKRWVNNYNEPIEVTDFDGNTAVVKRSVIIGAFLRYIIKCAGQQNKVKYKNLYFTSPVKQKSLFLKMYREILSEYNVIVKDTVDEAMAVIFHSVSGKIEALDYEDNEAHSVLVIDCGGGTSDMVKCDYTIRNASITSEIDMKIEYAHGDTNFGGNNLTYRILQYLKIKLAEFYTKTQNVSLEELFGDAMTSVYDFVDSYGIEKAYERFEQIYQRAEDIIPTCFEHYKQTAESSYLKVKGNFYFLWNLAERIKKEFFSRSDVFLYFLGKPPFGQQEKAVLQYKSFHIALRNKNKVFEMHTELPEVSITKEEVHAVLKPDIYNLVKHFIEPYYLRGDLSEIDRVCLSGQTCKIDLFREILKEYMEGRKSRAGAESSYAKKLLCINGAIAYQGAKRNGRIKPVIAYASPIIPYYLTAPDFREPGREVTLFQKGERLWEMYGYLSRYIEAEEVPFTLKNQDGIRLKEFRFPIDVSVYQKETYQEIMKRYPILRQEDLDNIQECEVKFFVFSDGDAWGFSVLGIARQNKELSLGDAIYFPFENEEWEMNFFNGLK